MKLPSLLGVLALAAWGLGSPGAPARADALDDIRARGVLVVGVKPDVPLWSLVHPVTGVPEGLEPDLAADLARRIGVGLRLVGVLTSDRLDVVERRKVDVLIATLSETPERSARVHLVAPRYYTAGANILARRQEHFRQWSDLRNRRVCSLRGVYFNRPITVTQGLDIVALYSNELALQALRDGRCDALLHYDVNIAAMLQEPRWAAAFEMPLETLYPAPWAIALHRDEAAGRLQALVSATVIEWHRSGMLLALERKWGIPPSAFASRMNALWTRRAGDAYLCGQAVTAATPADCL